MATRYLNRVISIKKLSLAATPPIPLPIHGFVGVIFLYIFFEWGRKICSLLTAPSSVKNRESELYKKMPSLKEEMDDESVSRAEVEMVFARLGISCHPESETLQERFSNKEFSGLFGEEGAFDADEVHAAFDVFDENKDGFIEEKELQRVICALGLNEGVELENCRNMIKMFDEDGDGMIDFSEFAKLI